MLPWAIGVVIAAAGVVAAPMLATRRPAMRARTVTAALVVVSVLAGAGAIFTVVQVGHSGAKATWEDVGEEERD